MKQLGSIDSQSFCFKMTRTTYLIFRTLLSRFCQYSIFRVSPCQNSISRPQVADGGKVHIGQLTRSALPALELGEVVTPSHGNNLCYEASQGLRFVHPLLFAQDM